MAKNETLHIRVNEVVKSRIKIPPAPESVTVHSLKELYEKLDVGIQQIQEGKVIDADVAMSKLR